MKKIKEILIHWLGGYTEEEKSEAYVNGYVDGKQRGKIFLINNIKNFADSLFGSSADEWCEKMYEYIKRIVEGYGRI